MATSEQLKEARKKAVKSPNIGKHGKRKKTIQKEIAEEEARSYFVQEILKSLKTLTKKEIQEAMKDFRVRHYVFDQLMGRAKDKTDLAVTMPQNLIDLIKSAHKDDKPADDKTPGKE